MARGKEAMTATPQPDQPTNEEVLLHRWGEASQAVGSERGYAGKCASEWAKTEHIRQVQ
jgi:hypothetical protein